MGGGGGGGASPNMRMSVLDRIRVLQIHNAG